jgi:hypothetical protein
MRGNGIRSALGSAAIFVTVSMVDAMSFTQSGETLAKTPRRQDRQGEQVI